MEKIVLNTGIKEIEVENERGEHLGVLRFNPTDPNLVTKFGELYKDLPRITKEYEAAQKAYKEKADALESTLLEDAPGATEMPQEVAELGEHIKTIDKELKAKFAHVFSVQNDFDAMLEGVNVFAGTDTGGTALENLLEALLPIIETNAENRQKLMQEKAMQARAQAEANREQRRAAQKNLA